MKNLTYLSFLAIFILLGCTKESPQLIGTDLDRDTHLRRSSKYLPFKAKVNLATTGFGNKCADQGSPPQISNPIVEGTGFASHLGNVSFVTNHCVFNSASFDPFKVKLGNGTFTAANGDQLSLTYDGTYVIDAPNSQLILTMDFEFTGGTGRFSDATGQGDYLYIAKFPNWPPNPPNDVAIITASLSGTISY